MRAKGASSYVMRRFYELMRAWLPIRWRSSMGGYLMWITTLLTFVEDLDLLNWYRSLPNGLETLLGSDGEGLSASEAQLLAFTRGFLANPGLVILDEASSRLEKYRQASRHATGQVSSAIGEIFSTVQGIQIAAAEPNALAHFQQLNERRRVTMLRDRVLERCRD